jgi:hypothetical protein
MGFTLNQEVWRQQKRNGRKTTNLKQRNRGPRMEPGLSFHLGLVAGLLQLRKETGTCTTRPPEDPNLQVLQANTHYLWLIIGHQHFNTSSFLIADEALQPRSSFRSASLTGFCKV